MLLLLGLLLLVHAAADGSIVVKGQKSVIKMHKSFLKVYSQDDLTPTWVGVADYDGQVQGGAEWHRVVLDNVPLSCASSWGTRPCVAEAAEPYFPETFSYVSCVARTRCTDCGVIHAHHLAPSSNLSR